MLTKITDNFYEDLSLVTRLLTGEIKGRPFVRYMRQDTQYLLWDEDAREFKKAYDKWHEQQMPKRPVDIQKLYAKEGQA
jgi:thiaminase